MRDRQREDGDDGEGDRCGLTAEAEWLIRHEEHDKDDGDGGQEDSQLPLLSRVAK